jgi:hypothetical protein
MSTCSNEETENPKDLVDDRKTAKPGGEKAAQREPSDLQCRHPVTPHA